MAASSIQIRTIIQEIESDLRMYYLRYYIASPRKTLEREPVALVNKFFEKYIYKKPWYPAIKYRHHSVNDYFVRLYKSILKTIIVYHRAQKALRPILDKSPQEVREIIATNGMLALATDIFLFHIEMTLERMIASWDPIAIEIFLLQLEIQPQFYIDVLTRIIMPLQKEASNLVNTNNDVLVSIIKDIVGPYTKNIDIDTYEINRCILKDIKQYVSNIDYNYKEKLFIFFRLTKDTLQLVSQWIAVLEENNRDKTKLVKVSGSLNDIVKPRLEEHVLNLPLSAESSYGSASSSLPQYSGSSSSRRTPESRPTPAALVAQSIVFRSLRANTEMVFDPTSGQLLPFTPGASIGGDVLQFTAQGDLHQNNRRNPQRR